MHTGKLFLETDSNGNLKQIPKLPPNVQLEVVIVKEKSHLRRKPSTKISGKGQILGNIMSAVTAENWNSLG